MEGFTVLTPQRCIFVYPKATALVSSINLPWVMVERALPFQPAAFSSSTHCSQTQALSSCLRTRGASLRCHLAQSPFPLLSYWPSLRKLVCLDKLITLARRVLHPPTQSTKIALWTQKGTGKVTWKQQLF